MAFVLTFASLARAVPCSVSQAYHLPDTHMPDAQAALEKHKPEDAIQLYQKALVKDPAAPALNAALAEAYLADGKVVEADANVTKAIAGAPHSAVLETVLAEVQLREGRPWDAQDAITRALADDPCYPDAHLVEGELLTYISMRGSAAQQFAIGYKLAPHDIGALDQYLPTLPLPQRMAAVREFMGREKVDPDRQKSFERYISRLEQETSTAAGNCRLVPSSPAASEIPLLPLMGDAQHVRAAGLDVKIEQHTTHLQIDTGSAGLIINSIAAAKAGLQYVSDTEISGIGSEGPSKGHVAYAKSVKIGSLEFRDCRVRVYERRELANPLDDIDGVIGMDTFRQFLITLDYPHGALRLAALPSPPNTPAEPIGLETGSDQTNLSNEDAGSVSNSTWRDRYIAPEMSDYSSAYRVGHNFVVPASISKGKIRLFILGTGADKTTVSTQLGREVGKLHRDHGADAFGFSGKVKDLYYVDQITFNFARVSVVTNQVSAIDMSSHGPMEISGLIGASALKQCTVHLDYRDGLIKMDYTPGPSRF
jgi:tetratricopeptide (TPR) repeat protein